MKNVFIIGSRGYRASYGGWETFVTSLVDNYKDKDTRFYITGCSFDKDEKIRNINSNITIIPIFVKTNTKGYMFKHTVKAFKYVYKYIKENNLGSCYLYILGLKLFNYLKVYKKRLKKLGITTLVNPDGLEHERSKWSKPIKKFFLISEKLMLKNVDKIVCDAKGIQKYVINKYPELKEKTNVIEYGVESFNTNVKYEEKTLKEYDLKDSGYLLVVGRCVPENNYEMVIKAFMNSKIKKELVIITNLSSGNYIEELKEKTRFDTDKRIRFIDGVYDRNKLASIRKHAYLYIHGHSVGGTNPSLIEALSLTDLNVLYDVCFNKDVGLDSCLYFKNDKALTNIFNDTKALDKSKKELGLKAKEIVKKNYTWDIITNKYKKLFK